MNLTGELKQILALDYSTGNTTRVLNELRELAETTGHDIKLIDAYYKDLYWGTEQGRYK